MKPIIKSNRQKETSKNGFYFGKSDIGKSSLLYRGEHSLPNDNLLVIGSKGSGKCHHPWDCLKPCVCGCEEHPVLANEKGALYGCGVENNAIFAVCLSCGRHTDIGTLSTAIDNWNRDNIYET